jgi:hypothetical protein
VKGLRDRSESQVSKIGDLEKEVKHLRQEKEKLEDELKDAMNHKDSGEETKRKDSSSSSSSDGEKGEGLADTLNALVAHICSLLNREPSNPTSDTTILADEIKRLLEELK